MGQVCTFLFARYDQELSELYRNMDSSDTARPNVEAIKGNIQVLWKTICRQYQWELPGDDPHYGNELWNNRESFPIGFTNNFLCYTSHQVH